MRLANRRCRFQQGIERPAQQRHLLPGNNGVRAAAKRGDIRKDLLAGAKLAILCLQNSAIASRAPSEIGVLCNIHPVE